jgi:lipid-binding SYLF domain-containing protein
MPRRSSSSDSLRRLALLAVAAGLAAGIAAAGRRITQRRQSSQSTYRCRCGSSYRVSGTDRHRVYWPAGAPESDPVLGDRCPNCDAPLPSGHEGAVV